MPIIFRKTAKGVAEIETRAHRLTPRMRSTLIMVDGKRDAEDLRALVAQQADELLGALEQQGFIEAVGETLRTPAAAAGAGPALVAREPTPALSIESARRIAVRTLNDELGPAAETMAIRIERARSLDELRPLLEQAVALVVSARGRAAGEAFAQRLPSL